MRVESLVWTPGDGWSAALPTRLDSDATLVVAFAAARSDRVAELVGELRTSLPHARIVGCSTAGQIQGDALSDESLVCSVARFDRSRVEVTTACVSGTQDSYDAGKKIADALHGPDLRTVFVLSDGLNVNGSELVRGISDGLPVGVTLTGGLAGDAERFERTWVLDQDRPVSGAVSAVGLYGPAIVVGSGSFGGWDDFGPERVLTRSDGNVLYEIDGRPALQLYKDYLGDRAAELPATGLLFPLTIRPGPGSERRLVRTILAVDEADQSMTFAGDVPQGWRGQLMHANKERLIDGAMRAAEMASVAETGGDQLAVAISCVGRRLVLGERTEDEIDAIREALPGGSHLLGFYSYGEIAPQIPGVSELHNQTMTLTTLAER